MRTSPMLFIAGAALAASITATAHAGTQVPPKSELTLYKGADPDAVCGPKPAGQPKLQCVVRSADVKGGSSTGNAAWNGGVGDRGKLIGWWVGDFDNSPIKAPKSGYGY